MTSESKPPSFPSADSSRRPAAPPPKAVSLSRRITESLRAIFGNQIVAWMILVLGLAGTFLAWNASLKRVEMDEKRSLDVTKSHIESALTSQMQTYEIVLESAQGLFNSSTNVTRIRWQQFCRSLKIGERCPGIHALGFIAHVPSQQLKSFEARARVDGSPHFTIRPKGDRKEYAVIRHIEPPSMISRFVGFDVATNPVEWPALERARDTGQPSATGRTTLSDDLEQRYPSFAVVLPVYRQGASTTTVEARRAALEGWIGAAFRVEDLMKALLAHRVPAIDLEIFDGPTPSKVSLLYDSDDVLRTVDRTYDPVLSNLSPIEGGGRIWTLSYITRPGFTLARGHWQPVAILAGGVVISVLLFVTILALTVLYGQTSREAASVIGELRLRNRALEAVSNGIVITNPAQADNPIIYVNPAFERITGYSAREVVGRNGRFLQGPDKDQGALEEVRRAIREERDCRVVLRNCRKNGTLFWNELSLSPVRDEAGRLTHFVGILVDMTERRLVEEALGEERSLLRTLIDNLPVCIYVKDTESRYIISNLAHVRLLGATMTDDVVGQTDFDFFPKELASRHFNDEQTIMRLGQAILDQEDLVADKHGHKRCFLTTKLPLKDGSGQIIGLVGVSRDITDRKHVVETLAEERNLLRALIDNAADFIYAKDAKGRFIIVNSAAAHVLGARTPAEVVGKTGYDYLPRDQAERDAFCEQQVLQTGKPFYDIERKRLDGSGNPVSCQTVLWPLRDSHGKVAGVVGIDRDITARVKAESDRALLAVAVQHATESIVITDQNGAIQYANASFELTSGFSRSQIVRKHLDTVQAQKMDGPFREKLWQTLQAGKTWKGPLVNLDVEGKEYLEEASISPMRDPNGNIIHFVAVKRDITHERQLEEQFRQAQKMEAVGQLAGGIAHDFNNTIGVILGYSELILRKLDRSDPIAAKIEAMRTAAQKASQIIRQLLAFSRRQLLQPRVIDLNTHVQQMVEMLQRLIGENIKLDIQAEAVEAHTRVDPNYLDQVVMNMAVNARDVMVEGGEFRLRTTNLKIESSQAGHYPGLSPGLHVVLSISDTGSGMPPEVCAHIFEPFFTTKGRGKGTGLGLSTAYGIIKQSGGHIDFESRMGKGTTFRIYLPCAQEGVDQIARSTVDGSVPRGTETVLVVEDERGVLEMVSELLDGLGYKVIKAINPDEALAQHEKHHGPIHLLFTDIVMPGMSGVELAKRFHPLRPDTKLLFTSGYAGRAMSEQGLLDLTFNFLAKPYDLPMLARKVREVLDAEHPPRKHHKKPH